jgi:hypothetical protein
MGKSESFKGQHGKRKGKKKSTNHHHDSKPKARAVVVQELSELDQLHRAQGAMLGKPGMRARRFERRTARDQRQRIETLNEGAHRP